MNKLKGLTSYIFGAIDRCPNGGKDWRDKVTPDLEKLGVTVINPLKKPVLGHVESIETRNNRHQAKLRGDWDLVIADKSIRLVDLRFCDKADFLVGCIDSRLSPCGTYEELFTANRQKKPILVWSPLGKMDIADWLWWTLPKEHIFENFDEVILHLKGINDGTIEPGKRWVFFDWQRA
jgi:hypothetical protein